VEGREGGRGGEKGGRKGGGIELENGITVITVMAVPGACSWGRDFH